MPFVRTNHFTDVNTGSFQSFYWCSLKYHWPSRINWLIYLKYHWFSGDQTLHVALKEALGKAYNLVDFSPFDQNKDGYIDMVTFVHSGCVHVYCMRNLLSTIPRPFYAVRLDLSDFLLSCFECSRLLDAFSRTLYLCFEHSSTNSQNPLIIDHPISLFGARTAMALNGVVPTRSGQPRRTAFGPTCGSCPAHSRMPRTWRCPCTTSHPRCGPLPALRWAALALLRTKQVWRVFNLTEIFECPPGFSGLLPVLNGGLKWYRVLF